ncbi:MAG: hypothetical protein ACT4OU_05185 [Hyphomicrobium sp.]
MPPTYDDIVYYDDAAERLQVLSQGGIGAVLQGYVVNPPHAPGSTLLAAIGFLVFGLQPWAANAANALPLLLFITLIVRLFADLPPVVSCIAIPALISMPIFGLAIVEFRPDMWCAGFTVVGTLLIALRDIRVFRTAVLAGASLAAALLFKPTFSPLIAILFGVALILRLHRDFMCPQRRRAALVACLTVLGIALIIAGPHYMLSLPRLIAYYREHVFGSGAQLWSPQLTVMQQAGYYVFGDGGRATLGRWPYVGVFTVLVPAILYIDGRLDLAWRSAIVFVLGLIAYVLVTAPGNKSAYLGMIFSVYAAAAILLSASLGLRYLSDRGNIVGLRLAGLAILFFAAAVYTTPRVALHGSAIAPETSASRRAISAEIKAYFVGEQDIARKTVMFAQIGQYANQDTLKFEMRQGGIPQPTFVGEYFVADIQKQAQLLAQSHYVVTITSDYPDRLGWLPSAKIAGEVSAMLGPQTGFTLAKTIVSPSEPGEIRIYKRQE